MVIGHQRSEWSRVSAVMALTANINRSSKRSKSYKPSDFDPYAPPPPPLTVEQKEAIIGAFMKGWK